MRFGLRQIISFSTFAFSLLILSTAASFVRADEGSALLPQNDSTRVIANDVNGLDKSGEIILAKVGNKTISLNEFLRRSEYTIRPPYCKSDNNIHKKIVMNSLIAEKLLALEAGENNELANNKHFNNYIRGRREQSMRELLYYNEGFEKVKLDTNKIKKEFSLAGRKYNIEYFSIPGDSLIHTVAGELNGRDSLFEKVFKKYWGDTTKIPAKEVEWRMDDNKAIHNALFLNKLNKGEVVGPVKLDKTYSLFIKVKGWTDRAAVTDQQIRERWNDVVQKQTNAEALKIYQHYIAGIMRGKKIEFNPDTFFKLVKFVAPVYLQSKKKKEDEFLHLTLNKKEENPTLNNLGDEIDKIKNDPIFTIDGHLWTVADLENHLEIHPLVFRQKNIGGTQFPEQFKLAIVDMVRDIYLTDEAYKEGLQNNTLVKRNAEMWKDAVIALYQRQKYLDSLGVKVDKNNYMKVISKYLDPYIQKLQQKYKNVVEVNVPAYDNIKLTRTDMFVIQKDVPFPVIVPSFPMLTTDNRLDYGKKMVLTNNK